jgi:hypothetical protein
MQLRDRVPVRQQITRLGNREEFAPVNWTHIVTAMIAATPPTVVALAALRRASSERWAKYEAVRVADAARIEAVRVADAARREAVEVAKLLLAAKQGGGLGK